MKNILILFAFLYGFVSFSQEENTRQLEPVRMTLQKQSTPSQLRATTISANKEADNNHSKTSIVNIIASKSTVRGSEKATLSIADDKTNITNAPELKRVFVTVERSSKPQTSKTTAIKKAQKQ